jgi:SAM-dependent methyltransferase
MNEERLRRIGRAVLPFGARQWLRDHRSLFVWPPVGRVRFGSLRRTQPVDANYGYTRGRPIDRYYIEAFLAERANDVRGAALEFQDTEYLRRFGGPAVTSMDVMNVEADYPGTTIAADVAVEAGLPVQRFDCIVCTGVVQLVYDIESAVRNLHRMLRPGGVLLATMPGISKLVREDVGWADQWRLTSSSAKTLFGSVFGVDNVDVHWYGNPLVAISSLMGLATEDLKPHELDARHPEFEVLIAVRAIRAD